MGHRAPPPCGRRAGRGWAQEHGAPGGGSAEKQGAAPSGDRFSYKREGLGQGLGEAEH